MSLSYAAKLSKDGVDYVTFSFLHLFELKQKGVCGLAEIKDTRRAYEVKLKHIFELFQKAQHILVFTGS
jgi:hypothetical protein